MISPNISKNILLILIRLLETKLIIRGYVLFNDSYMKNASNLLFHVHLWEPELHALLMVKQVVGKLIQWMEISKMDALEFIILGLKIYLCKKGITFLTLSILVLLTSVMFPWYRFSTMNSPIAEMMLSGNGRPNK